MKKPVILMILDGFGIAPEKGNAIKAAKKPNIDKLFASNPLTQIGASGMDVGLPDGQMGNSEVGHTNMGAGRIVYQELTRITKTINEDKLKDNEAIVDAMDKALKNGTALHLMGLLSDGGVHSHIEHLYGILELAKKKGLKDVYIHAFLDGRDVPPSSAAEYADKLLNKLKEIGIGKVATVEGRYYAMDRDNNWDRVEKAYAAMVYGEGNKADCPVCAIKNSYNDGVTDEFVVPCVIEGGAQVKPNDSIIFFNFRPDRAREITRTFCDDAFDGFFTNTKIKDVKKDYIATVITEREITKMSNQLDHTMGSYMLYFQFLCVVLSAVLIYLLTKIIIEKNEVAISMTKILGYTDGEIAKLYLLATTIVVIVCAALSVLVGTLVMRNVWTVMLQSMSGWFTFIMGPLDYIKMFAFIFVGYLVVMLFDFRRIRKIPLDEALKRVE